MIASYVLDVTVMDAIVKRHSGQTPSVMVWSTIGRNMWSRLVRIQGNRNINRYIREVLKLKALPLFQATSHSTFQQDNAQPHVVRIVQAFF